MKSRWNLAKVAIAYSKRDGIRSALQLLNYQYLNLVGRDLTVASVR